jgi:hypothetical protein
VITSAPSTACAFAASDLLTAALAYAAAGVPVVPLFDPDPRRGCRCSHGQACRRPGKHPRNRGGLTGASTDPAVIGAWWATWPTANIGGLTGHVFDVCDVDGADGIAAVAPLLEACHGVVPLVRTGSGGWHLLFKPTGLGCRVRFIPGTDWRGIGGYVVLPPSQHVSGARYAQARHGQLPAVPAALLAALTPPAPAAARAAAHHPVARLAGYGPAALNREAETVAATGEGGRNHALNRAAFSLGQLIAAGHLTEDEVTEGLTAAAGRAGLDEHEAARTIASGIRAGHRNPRPTRTAGRAA